MMAKSLEDERLLIIGWDGADWEIIDDLIGRGCLPNLAAMIEDGARGDLSSTIPSHSWAAWSTFLTGMNPGEHGVYDFVEMHPTDLGRRVPVSSSSIKATTFFESLSQAGHEVRVANVPVTFPPTPVRGRMISGVAIPPGTRFVYPDDWAHELKRRAAFPINGMEWTRYKKQPEALVEEAQRFIEERTASFEILLEGRWKVATCVYVAPDRLQHPFGAYLLPSHPDHDALKETMLAESIRGVFRVLDRQIERLRAMAGPNTTTVLMSDHGFRPVSRGWNLGAVLGTLGFAPPRRAAGAINTVRRSSLVSAIAKRRLGRAVKQRVRAPSRIDWKKTVAYQSILGFGVSVNLRGREPNGIVHPRDYERTCEEVRDALLEFKDPETQSAPVGTVLPKEEVYQGRHVDLAPDLVVGSEKLWAFSQIDKTTSWIDWPTGAHRRRGILVASGGRTVSGHLGERDIADIAATALAFCDVSHSSLDGRSIEQIAGREPKVGNRQEILASPSNNARPPKLSDEEEESIARHLRSLGYIE